ncbi:LysR family transcriptional regulator [Pandoraea sputorum]|uniref:LysR family transcriptional regulator n=1 Tax=Pandoraea sputorum TaxID=93222 RepID=UPI001E3B5D9A|nr:LysR family transcriptional regulator [Pandoraea sputorum]MCE4063385.1 LysR family transcriptional regulator [Pandoraea sputorum]
MVDFKGVDLNLLVTLDALLADRNVTHAAERLGLSQPAVSAQLARLRRLFGDPLLIPADTGRGMIATARALTLLTPLRAALSDLATVVHQSPTFDPMSDARRFVIAASDNATSTIGMALLEALPSVTGKAVQIAFVHARAADIAAQLESGEVDLLIGSERMVPPTMRARKLVDETFVMAQRKSHPRGTRKLTLSAYCALRHVLVSTSGGSFMGFVDEHLQSLGRSRDVAVSVQAFTVVPDLLCHSDYVCTMPAQLVSRYADRLDAFALPFPLPGFSLSAAWHPRNHNDPGMVWLRERLSDTAAAISSALTKRGREVRT